MQTGTTKILSKSVLFIQQLQRTSNDTKTNLAKGKRIKKKTITNLISRKNKKKM